MLNSNLLNKINVNDEWYTQEYAIKPILEFLKPDSAILCPFDKIDSKFVCILEKMGIKFGIVILTMELTSLITLKVM